MRLFSVVPLKELAQGGNAERDAVVVGRQRAFQRIEEARFHAFLARVMHEVAPVVLFLERCHVLWIDGGTLSVE